LADRSSNGVGSSPGLDRLGCDDALILTVSGRALTVNCRVPALRSDSPAFRLPSAAFVAEIVSSRSEFPQVRLRK
jgi:hypothetical protein